jgi:hypothetical protein
VEKSPPGELSVNAEQSFDSNPDQKHSTVSKFYNGSSTISTSSENAEPDNTFPFHNTGDVFDTWKKDGET